jgi:hypothetical protein
MNEMSCNNYDAQAQSKRDLITKLFDEECAKIYDRIFCISDAFYSDIEGCIPRWVNDAVTSTEIKNIFKVKSQATEFTSELVQACSTKVKRKTEEWVKEHFIPTLTNEIKSLAQTMDAKTTTYMDELSNLRVCMDIDKQVIINKTTPSSTNRVLSAGASILLGDLGGAIMGGAGGFDATLKTIGCEVGAGVVLGVISLFTPVGLTGILVGVILSAIVGSKWSLSTMESKIRQKVADKMVESIKSKTNKDRFNSMITSNVEKSLKQLRQNVNSYWDELLCA